MSCIVGTVADSTISLLMPWPHTAGMLFAAAKPRFVPPIRLFFALVLNHNGTVN